MPHHDDPTPLLDRRRALGLLGGGLVGGVLLAACGGSGDDDAASSTTTSTTRGAADDATTTSTASDSTGVETSGRPIGQIPEETGGPYPADGTNGPNVLTESGVARSDIRGSFASGSGTADGVPLTIELTLVDHSTGAPLPGGAIYLWHCDRQGRYSLYSQGATGANFLRGLQVADGSGLLRFTSIFPGAYAGRWPHIHFEVFDDQASATNGRNAVRTSQLALPAATCQQVYASSGYETSAGNMGSSSLSSDMVFRDGVDLQLASMSGSVSGGYTARLTVGI